MAQKFKLKFVLTGERGPEMERFTNFSGLPKFGKLMQPFCILEIDATILHLLQTSLSPVKKMRVNLFIPRGRYY